MKKGIPNLIKQKLDRVNLMGTLSNKVGRLLALTLPPTHYFSSQGNPLLTMDDVIAEGTKGPVFCQNSMQFRKDYIMRR